MEFRQDEALEESFPSVQYDSNYDTADISKYRDSDFFRTSVLRAGDTEEVISGVLDQFKKGLLERQSARFEELRAQDPNHVEWTPVCTCKQCPRGYTGVCKVSESEMIDKALDGEQCEYTTEFPRVFAVNVMEESDAVDISVEEGFQQTSLVVKPNSSTKFMDTFLHKLVYDPSLLSVSYPFSQNSMPRGVKILGKAKFTSEANGSTALLLDKHTSVCFAYSSVSVKGFDLLKESSYHDVLPVAEAVPVSGERHRPTIIYQSNAAYTIAMNIYVTSLPSQPVSLFHTGIANVLLPESQASVKNPKAMKGQHGSDLYILPTGQIGLFEDYGPSDVVLKPGEWNTVVLTHSSFPSPQLTVFINGICGAEIGDKQQLGNRQSLTSGVFTLFASPQMELTACTGNFKLGFVRFVPAMMDSKEDLTRILLNTPFSRWDMHKENRDTEIRMKLSLSSLYPKPPPIWAHPLFLQLAGGPGDTQLQMGLHPIQAFLISGAANDLPHLYKLVQTCSEEQANAQAFLRSVAQALLWMATSTGKPATPQQIVQTQQTLPEGSCAFVPVPTVQFNEEDPKDPLEGHLVFIVERKSMDVYHFAVGNTLLNGGIRHHPMSCTPENTASPHYTAPNISFTPVVPLCDVNYTRATSHLFWIALSQGLSKRTETNFLTTFDIYHRILPLLWEGSWTDVDQLYTIYTKNTDNTQVYVPMALSLPIVFDMYPLDTEGSYLETLLHCILYMARRKGYSKLIASILAQSMQYQCLRLCFQDTGVQPYLGASDHAVISMMLEKTCRFTADITCTLQSTHAQASEVFAAITHDAVVRLKSALEKGASPLSDYEYLHAIPSTNSIGDSLENAGYTDEHKKHPQMDHLLQYQDISELIGEPYGDASTVFVDINSIPRAVFTPSDILYCLQVTLNTTTRLMVNSVSVANSSYLVFNTIYQVFTQVVPVPSSISPLNTWPGPWEGAFTYAQQVQVVSHLFKLSVLLVKCYYSVPSQKDADSQDARLEMYTDWVPRDHTFHQTIPQTHVTILLLIISVMTDYILHKPTMDVVNPLTTVLNAGKWGLGLGTLATLTNTMMLYDPELAIARTRCLDYITACKYTHPIFLWKTNKAEHNVLTLYSSFAQTMKYPVDNNGQLDDIFSSTPNRGSTYYFQAYHPELQHYRDICTMLRIVSLLEVQAHTAPSSIHRCAPSFTVSGNTVIVRLVDKSITFAPLSLAHFPSYSEAQVITNEDHRKRHFESENKDTYVPVSVTNEEDILHLPNLPQFNGQMSQSDAERYLSILTAPYLRIPLLLEFISQPGKIHSLLSHDLSKSLFSAIFEPGSFETMEQQARMYVQQQDQRKDTETSSPYMSVPYKPELLSTRYGFLLNECLYDPLMMSRLCHNLMQEAVQLDAGSPYSTTVTIILFCVRVSVGVLKYLVWLRNYKNNGNAMYPCGTLLSEKEQGDVNEAFFLTQLNEAISIIQTDLARVSASILLPWLDITKDGVSNCLLKLNNDIDHSKDYETYEATIAQLRKKTRQTVEMSKETIVAPLELLLGLQNNDTKVALDTTDMSVAVELACAIHVHNTLIHSAFIHIAIVPRNLHPSFFPLVPAIAAHQPSFGGYQAQTQMIQTTPVTYASADATRDNYMNILAALTIPESNITTSVQHLLSAVGYLQSRSSWTNVLPVPDMIFLQAIQTHTHTLQQCLQTLQQSQTHSSIFDSLVGVVMGSLSHGGVTSMKESTWIMAPGAAYTKWCRVVPSANTTEITTDVEIDTQQFQVTVRSSHLQALPNELAADPIVVFHLGFGSSQAAVIETTANRTWYRVIGRELDVFHWQPEPRKAELPYSRQYSPEDLYPSESWLVPIFEPVRLTHFNDKMDPTPVFLQTKALDEDTNVAHLVVMRQSSGAAWKEVFVYRHTAHVEVFTIMSYGRRWYRTQSYTTNHHFSLHQPSINDNQEDPWDAWARWEAGQCRENISNSGDAVIEREALPHPNIYAGENISKRKERYIPDILLQGSLPQALISQYTFWQCDADIIRGYPVNAEKTPYFIHISQLSLATHSTHQRRLACGQIRRVDLHAWKEFADQQVMSSVEDLLDVQSLHPSHPQYSSICSLAYVNGLSQVLCWVAPSVLVNNEFSENVQFAQVSNQTDHSLGSIRSIEVPQQNVSFILKRDPSGEVQLYNQDHPNQFVSPLHLAIKHRIHRPYAPIQGDTHTIQMLTKLAVSLPLSQLLQSAEGAFHILSPALEPSRPTLKGRPMSTELVYPDNQWLSEFNTSYMLFAVHSSLEFILPSTSSSSLYVLLHKYLNRDYVGCCQIIDACTGDEKYTAIEEILIDHVFQCKVSEDPNAYAFLVQFLFALRHTKLRTWNPFPIVAKYSGFSWIKYTAAECRVSTSVEIAMLELLLDHIGSFGEGITNKEEEKGFKSVIYPALVYNRHAILTSKMSLCVSRPDVQTYLTVNTTFDVKELHTWLLWMEEGAQNGTIPPEFAHLEEEEEEEEDAVRVDPDYTVPHMLSRMKKFYYKQNTSEQNKVLLPDLIIQGLESPPPLSLLYGLLTGEVISQVNGVAVEFDLVRYILTIRKNVTLYEDPLYWVLRAVILRPNLARHLPKIETHAKMVFSEESTQNYGCVLPNSSYDWTDLIVNAVELILSVDTYIPEFLHFTPNTHKRAVSSHMNALIDNRMGITLHVSDADQEVIGIFDNSEFEAKLQNFPYITGTLHVDPYLYKQPLGALGKYVCVVTHKEMLDYKYKLGSLSQSTYAINDKDRALFELLDTDLSKYPAAQTHTAKAMVKQLSTDVYEYSQHLSSAKYNSLELLHPKELSAALLKEDTKYIPIVQTQVMEFMQEVLTQCEKTNIALSAARSVLTQLLTSHSLSISGETDSLFIADPTLQNIEQKHVCPVNENFTLDANQTVIRDTSSSSAAHPHLDTSKLLMYLLDQQARRENKVPVLFTVSLLLSKHCEATLCSLLPFICPCRARLIRDAAVNQVFHSSRLDALHRVLSETHTLHAMLVSSAAMNDKEAVFAMLTQKAEAIADALAVERPYILENMTSEASQSQYYLDPRILVFEFTISVLIRNSQYSMLQSFLSSLSQGHSKVQQLIMGAGKTTVIAPLLALSLSDGERMVLQVVPPALLQFSTTVLRSAFSSIIRKPVCVFSYDRSTVLTKQQMYRLEECTQNRGVILATPTSVKSVLLRYLEICSEVHNSTLPCVELTEQLEALRTLLLRFRLGYLLVDEVDLVLHPLKSELNFPLGNKEPLDLSPYRWQLATHLLDGFFAASKTAKEDIPVIVPSSFKDVPKADLILRDISKQLANAAKKVYIQFQPHIALLNTDWYHLELKPLLLEWLMQWLSQAHIHVPEWCIKQYILEPEHLLAMTLSVKSEFTQLMGTLDEKKVQLLNLSRAWLHSYLPHCLSRICNVHYGLLLPVQAKQLLGLDPNMPVSRLYQAIPFVGKDTPSQASEFAHPDMTIGFTYLAYRHQGLRFGDIVSLINDLQSHYEGEVGVPENRPSCVRYRGWIEDHGGFVRMESVHQDVEKVEVLSLRLIKKSNHKHMNRLYDLLHDSASVAQYYVCEIVFPTFLRFQAHKISACGVDQGGSMLFKQRVGFSGTPSSLLPLSMGTCEHQRTADAQVLALLTSTDITSCMLLDRQWSAEKLLVTIATAVDSKKKPLYHALIDTGALITGLSNEMVARKLLSYGLVGYDGVVFLGEDDKKLVLVRSTGRVADLEQCGVPIERRFAFYDQVHTTGMDIKHTVNARAAITVNKDMVWRDYAQGAYRMRGIGKGQKVCVFIPPEVLADAHRTLGVDISPAEAAYNEEFHNQNVLRGICAWLLLNSMETENLQYVQLSRQNASDVWRYLLVNLALYQGNVAENAQKSISEYLTSIPSDIISSLPTPHPLLQTFLGTTRVCVPQVTESLQLLLENVDTSVPRVLPSNDIHANSLAAMVKEHLHILPTQQQELSARIVHITVQSSDVNIHLQTEMVQTAEDEKEKEQEQEQEREVELEKFVDLGFSRDNETPVEWNQLELTRFIQGKSVHPFYPAKDWNLCETNLTQPFSDNQYLSRNYYNPDWTGIRRLRNTLTYAYIDKPVLCYEAQLPCMCPPLLLKTDYHAITEQAALSCIHKCTDATFLDSEHTKKVCLRLLQQLPSLLSVSLISRIILVLFGYDHIKEDVVSSILLKEGVAVEHTSKSWRSGEMYMHKLYLLRVLTHPSVSRRADGAKGIALSLNEAQSLRKASLVGYQYWEHSVQIRSLLGNCLSATFPSSEIKPLSKSNSLSANRYSFQLERERIESALKFIDADLYPSHTDITNVVGMLANVSSSNRLIWAELVQSCKRKIKTEWRSTTFRSHILVPSVAELLMTGYLSFSLHACFKNNIKQLKSGDMNNNLILDLEEISQCVLTAVKQYQIQHIHPLDICYMIMLAGNNLAFSGKDTSLRSDGGLLPRQLPALMSYPLEPGLNTSDDMDVLPLCTDEIDHSMLHAQWSHLSDTFHPTATTDGQKHAAVSQSVKSILEKFKKVPTVLADEPEDLGLMMSNPQRDGNVVGYNFASFEQPSSDHMRIIGKAELIGDVVDPNMSYLHLDKHAGLVLSPPFTSSGAWTVSLEVRFPKDAFFNTKKYVKYNILDDDFHVQLVPILILCDKIIQYKEEIMQLCGHHRNTIENNTDTTSSITHIFNACYTHQNLPVSFYRRMYNAPMSSIHGADPEIASVLLEWRRAVATQSRKLLSAENTTNIDKTYGRALLSNYIPSVGDNKMGVYNENVVAVHSKAALLYCGRVLHATEKSLIPADCWCILTITYDGGFLRVYVNDEMLINSAGIDDCLKLDEEILLFGHSNPAFTNTGIDIRGLMIVFGAMTKEAVEDFCGGAAEQHYKWTCSKCKCIYNEINSLKCYRCGARNNTQNNTEE